MLDTESLVMEVAKAVCERHGAQLTAEAARASLGKRPLEAWATVAAMLGIQRSAQELFDESEPLLVERCAALGLGRSVRVPVRGVVGGSCFV